jgi:ubiquinone/menaquinone biosynthesis C-methylase UbiE
MVSSFSFDPLADRYDATRGYPPGVAQQIARDIARALDARPGARFLEVGVGTGRIAVPLASLGFDYSGVDISGNMVAYCVAKLREQGWQEEAQSWGSLPDEQETQASEVWRFRQTEPPARMRLALADMMALPFVDASFDVSLGVHVFHLVPDWQQAIREAIRVVRPGGLFVRCWDEHRSEEKELIDGKWREILKELGVEIRNSRSFSGGVIEQWLRADSLRPEIVSLTRWETLRTPRERVEHFVKRVTSDSHRLPDELFRTASERLERWAQDFFGEQLDMPHVHVHEFMVCKTEVANRA